MPLQARELYGSANGDRWWLTRDSNRGGIFVRHEPNLPPGGRISESRSGSSSAHDGSGPEYQELMRLIGILVEPWPSV
jgi:hypothetical protein